MIVNISGHKHTLDAMLGFKNTVTDHLTADVLQLLDYQSDVINYENRYRKITTPK